ncbi:sugar ABC transporter permease [Photobacterium sp. BZF1]|uniref:carbohydrate ABC transporter permease n=1 Tax=Photobacterium sp. BZF1 TaxID=1904457 RepID=UPI001653CB14|nr:sugar ABC transporter permease [Photobacterium sp. BZF1]MBC7004829.1 sugar ABC transporter permease [Photobacterium sp. BZF1]
MTLDKRQRAWGWMMGGPAFFGLAFFVILPFIMAIAMTFTNQRLLSPYPTEFVGMQNYERLLGINYVVLPPLEDKAGELILDEDDEPIYPRLRTVLRADYPKLRYYYELASIKVWDDKEFVLLARDPVFWRSLWNTLSFVLLVVPLQGCVALGLALLVNQGLKGTLFFRTVFFAPVVTSMVVVSIVWTFLYHKDLGAINVYLHWFSLGFLGPVDWLGDKAWAMPSIVIMSAWQGAGVQMLIFLAGLQSIPKELYEAASIDGANRWQRFRYITLPGLKNTLVFIVISTTIAAFGLFTQVDVMTQGGPQDSTSTVMYHAITQGYRQMDIAYGATISVVYFVVIFIIALLQKRFLSRRQK